MSPSTGNLELSQVVVVDIDDNELGTMNKAEVHADPGFLHRAVSLCIFDELGRVLLQQRQAEKYHFALRWSNACCTHPLPGEPSQEAVRRSARDELGVALVTLEYCGSFIYRALDVHSHLVEWEFDHVFAGTIDEQPRPNSDEVAEIRWCTLGESVVVEIDQEAQTPWLMPVLGVFTHWKAGSTDWSPPLEQSD